MSVEPLIMPEPVLRGPTLSAQKLRLSQRGAVALPVRAATCACVMKVPWMSAPLRVKSVSVMAMLTATSLAETRA